MFLRYLLLVGLAANALASLESLMEQLENNCPSKGDFRCRNSRCVPNTKRCDGKDDCFDGSDEFDCDQFFCKGPLFFKCKNEKCISFVFQCDEENDCGDFSDETDCEYFRMSTPSSANCSKGEWQCSDRLCIPDEWVCNGDSDCLDGSDEVLGCTKLLPCDGFKCKNGHCVPNEWRCDGTNDCNDNSDEIGCENHIDPQNCRFDDRLFLCSNNQTCLQFSQVCDGIVQCGDGSDESPGCRNSFNDCQTISCSHDCFHFPNGPKCLCPLGYHTVNDRTCEDINECEIYGICDQKCRNTVGSYECLCDKKYTLQDDKRTCKAEGGEAMMVFSSKTEIRGYFLQSQVYFPIAKRLKQVVGVGFDGHHIYWTDISSGHESITRSLEDGSNREFLVTSGLGAPEDLAVDWITGNIYFTDSEMQHIGVCTSDGSKCTVLVNKDIDKPRGIALNPAEGEMFWSDWGDNAMIARSLMDGTQDKAFISTDIKWPNGLAIDYGNERLYWVDAKFQTLESVRLDGTDRRIILKGIVKHPYAIAVFENNLYWSDWTTHSIQTCDKFTGKNHKILLKEKKDYIYGIHIFHSALKQPKLDNPCSRSFCSDLHLLSGRGCTCACPQDKILSIDKHVCLASEKRQVLIIGGKNLLAQVEHRMLGTHEMNALPTVAKDIIALAYSPSNGTLFISDASTASIVTMNLVSGEESSVLFHADSESRIASLAYDYAGNNLYWCDTKKETVEILSLHTMTRKVLMHDMAGEVPTSIALVPSKGVMFIAFKRTNQGYHIDRFRMDGTGRTHVIDRGLLGPVTLLFEPGLYRIFWADAGTGMIESTSIQGDDRHIFRSVHTSPISLAALNRDLFWTNEKMKALMWTDKQNTNYDRKITLDLPSDVDSIYIVSATSRPINPHPCHVNNGNCSHLCLASDKTYLCACPLGMNLRPDNVTCYKPSECSVGEFFCAKSDVCIPTSNVCNGHRDCILGDDEEDCPDEPPCSQDEFRCKNGACIKATSVCDLHYDCTDNSDEDSDSCSDYKNGNLCPDGNFRCNSGTCLSNRFLCDGMNDCYDGEDEVDCKFITCSEDQFRCATGSCIPKSWECDKHFDCYDLSDEHAGCEPPPCSSQYFTCKNRRCIDLTLLCDNNDDCGDLSDELKCERTESENPCNITEYRCDDVCLPQSAICNGTVECPQAEDEKDCSNCNIGEFECRNGKCLIREWVCDGVDDCGDASDERNDVCSRKNETVPWTVATSKTSIPCADGYQCKNGNCLDLSLVCNGQEDCYDGSDEHGVCNTSCDTNSNPCDQKCVRTPSGPMCVCHVGYKLLGDGQTCADIKECGREPPICSQLCTEMPGSFVCGCRKGYLLRSDRKSCKSVGDAMSMIFVAGNQIRRLNELDDTLTVLYADETPEITGLDVSVAEDLVYFSIKDTGTIHRLNLKSNTREYMLNAGAPSQLTVDWITQNVYFVDGSGYDGAVKMCNFDRREFATLFKLEGNVQLSAIVVDPINKFLFYAATTWRIFNSPNSMVVRTTLDGAKTTELMKFTKSHVTGLAADPYAKQIYLADQHNGKIHRIDYDGASSALLIASNLSRPYGLNHFEDHLFFKVRGSGFMKKCKLFGDESRVCDIFRMGGTSSDLFAISQISRQPSIENVCAAANCTALCVPAGVGPKCLCPDGSGVPQGQPCIPHPNIVGEETKPTFKKHDGLLRESPKQTSGSAIVGVVGLLLVLLFIGLGYLYMRRRNTGKFDIRMKFYNPLFGMQPPTNTNTETDSERQTVLQPGEHEYCNPVHINKQDMEAATKAILSKVNPLVKIDE